MRFKLEEVPGGIGADEMDKGTMASILGGFLSGMGDGGCGSGVGIDLLVEMLENVLLELCI